MTDFNEIKNLLESDELYYEASLASNFTALAKRLSRHETTEKLNKFLIEENELEKIIEYVQATINQTEKGTNINDIAICCCVLVLCPISPTEELEKLINSLKECSLPSLRWASSFAKYCDQFRLSLNTFNLPSQKEFQEIKEQIDTINTSKNSRPYKITNIFKLNSIGGSTYAKTFALNM